MRIRERFNPHAPFEARRGGRLAPASNDRFNPRTPCGARQRGRKGHHGQGGISTHAPLAGRDVENVSGTLMLAENDKVLDILLGGAAE